MRLYDAATCTPCWDGSTSQSKTNSYSLTISSIKNNGSVRTKPETSSPPSPSQQEQKVEEPDRFQFISKKLSYGNTTTRGETPLYSNISSQTHYSTKEKESSGEDDEQRQRPTLVGRDIAKQKEFRVDTSKSFPAIKDYYYGKYAPQKKDPLDLDDDGVGSCSTLTTRDDLFLDQEDCAITVSSLSCHKGVKGVSTRKDVVPHSNQNANKQRNIIKDRPHLLGAANQVLPSPLATIDTKKPTSIRGVDHHQPIRKSLKEQVSAPSCLDQSSEEPKAASKRMVPDSLNGHRGTSRFVQQQPPSQFIPLSTSGKHDGDDFVAVKSKLKKVSTSTRNNVKNERLEFFPVQQQSQSRSNIDAIGPEREPLEQDSGSPRLGASGKFPSVADLFDPFSADDWDPVCEEEKSSSSSSESWVDFNTVEETSNEDRTPPPVTVRPNDDCFLFSSQLEQASKDLNNTSVDALLQGWDSDYNPTSSTPISFKDPSSALQSHVRRRPDIRKLYARGEVASSHKGLNAHRDILKKPSLLGPLLVDKFTRSYWRRLKYTDRQVSKERKSDSGRLQYVDSLDNTWNAKPTNSKSDAITFKTINHANRNTATTVPGLHDILPGTTSDETATTADGVLEKNAGGNSNAKFFSLDPDVTDKCDKVAERLGLGALKAIDEMDGESVSVKDLLDLQSLFVTEPLARLMRDHVKDVSQHLSAKTKNFLTQMFGVREFSKKVEAILFCKTFPAEMTKLSSDCLLLQRASDEITASRRLRKVLGIILMIGNRLVGKEPGRKKATIMTLEALKNLLDEAETKEGSTQFLAHVCSRIQKTKPSLLDMKKEMPTLSKIKLVKWEAIETGLGMLEAKFEYFRNLVLSLNQQGGAICNSDTCGLTIEDEIEVLQSTAIGSYAIESCLQMAAVYECFDSAKASYELVLAQFQEDGRVKAAEDSSEDPFAIVARFCNYVDP